MVYDYFMENTNNKYTKDFDGWNLKKKALNKRVLPPEFFFLEREVWWASLGVNIGHEINGKHERYERPVLVLKKIDFDSLLILPITSTILTGINFYLIEYKGQKMTLLFNQIKSISANRLIRLIRRLDENEFSYIKSMLLDFCLKNETPHCNAGNLNGQFRKDSTSITPD